MADPARGLVMVTMTVDEFLVHPSPDGFKTELVRGELRMSPPPGGPHGRAATNLVILLSAHTRPRRLGWVWADGIGYELRQLPRTVRVPDASFVRADRLPAGGVRPGLLKFAPDLAIEVLSPGESAKEIEEKIDDYLKSGTPLIWVVDPVRRTVRVVSTDSTELLLREGETLTGGRVLPDFACAVDEIFDGIARDA